MQKLKLITALQSSQYLDIHFLKVQVLYTVNSKMLLNQRREHIVFMDWKTQHIKDVNSPS